jgi:hypothetical protein
MRDYVMTTLCVLPIVAVCAVVAWVTSRVAETWGRLGVLVWFVGLWLFGLGYVGLYQWWMRRGE